MEEARAEVVAIPWPVMGHVQIVEFAKLIIHHQNHLPPGKKISVTVLIMKLPDYIDTVTSSFVDLLRASGGGAAAVNFFELPQTEPGPDWNTETRGFFTHSLVLSQRRNVADYLRSRRPNVAAVVVDMLCTSMIHVAEEFRIPSYIFYPSPASFLGAMLHCQTLHDDHNQDVSELGNSESGLVIPSYAEPVPPDVLSLVLLDKLQWRNRFLDYSRDYRKAKGIIINTFSDLETHALDSFSGLGPRIPPVYPVGPILNQGPMSDSDNGGAGCLRWLDGQPLESVLVVCFGSQGSLSEAQIKEVAVGLESSGRRFLWSLRRQSSEGQKASFPSEYASYKEVLPEGFLERTSGVGKVTGWIPQLRVLSHAAVGGFVSHCGWNSVLESLWCGVPIATWPLHAEQHMNAFQLVRELGLAVEITLTYRERSGDTMAVAAAEVERGVREVMESGSEVRKRVKEMKEKSRLSLVEGGSSYISFKRLIDDIISNVTTS